MIDLQGRIFDRCQDVFALQKGVVGKDFLKRGARAEQLQNVNDPHAFAPNAGATSTLIGFDRDSPEEFGFHKVHSNIKRREKRKGPGPWESRPLRSEDVTLLRFDDFFASKPIVFSGTFCEKSKSHSLSE